MPHNNIREIRPGIEFQINSDSNPLDQEIAKDINKMRSSLEEVIVANDAERWKVFMQEIEVMENKIGPLSLLLTAYARKKYRAFLLQTSPSNVNISTKSGSRQATILKFRDQTREKSRLNLDHKNENLFYIRRSVRDFLFVLNDILERAIAKMDYESWKQVETLIRIYKIKYRSNYGHTPPFKQLIERAIKERNQAQSHFSAPKPLGKLIELEIIKSSQKKSLEENREDDLGVLIFIEADLQHILEIFQIYIEKFLKDPSLENFNTLKEAKLDLEEYFIQYPDLREITSVLNEKFLRFIQEDKGHIKGLDPNLEKQILEEWAQSIN